MLGVLVLGVAEPLNFPHPPCPRWLSLRLEGLRKSNFPHPPPPLHVGFRCAWRACVKARVRGFFQRLLESLHRTGPLLFQPPATAPVVRPPLCQGFVLGLLWFSFAWVFLGLVLWVFGWFWLGCGVGCWVFRLSLGSGVCAGWLVCIVCRSAELKVFSQTRFFPELVLRHKSTLAASQISERGQKARPCYKSFKPKALNPKSFGLEILQPKPESRKYAACPVSSSIAQELFDPKPPQP